MLEQTLSDIIIDLKALDKRLFEIQTRFDPAINDTINTLVSGQLIINSQT